MRNRCTSCPEGARITCGNLGGPLATAQGTLETHTGQLEGDQVHTSSGRQLGATARVRKHRRGVGCEGRQESLGAGGRGSKHKGDPRPRQPWEPLKGLHSVDQVITFYQCSLWDFENSAVLVLEVPVLRKHALK